MEKEKNELDSLRSGDNFEEMQHPDMSSVNEKEAPIFAATIEGDEELERNAVLTLLGLFSSFF